MTGLTGTSLGVAWRPAASAQHVHLIKHDAGRIGLHSATHRGTQAMSCHRGEDRLNIFRQNMLAFMDQRPGTAALHQPDGGAR